LGANKYLVAFTNSDVRWDPFEKGLVVAGSGTAKDEIYKPGEWVTIEGSRADLSELAGAWAVAPPPKCATSRVWIAEKIYYTMSSSPKAVPGKTGNRP
jgi:hypothetical protein